MFTKQLILREAGLKGYDAKPFYNELFATFECCRLDEYHIEGKELGDLIPPLACNFSKADPDCLAVVDEDGGILIVNTLKSCAVSSLHDWQTHTNAVFDVDWMPGEAQLITASGDQSIALWDVATEEKISSFRGHTSSVKTARFLPDSRDVFASGSRDGHIMIWDKRISQKDGSIPPITVIQNPHSITTRIKSEKKKKRFSAAQDKGTHSVTAVLFQDDSNLFSAGSTDSSVKVWDTRKTYSVSKTSCCSISKHTFSGTVTAGRPYGISCLTLDSTRTRLFASCLDSCIYEYNCAAFNPSRVSVRRGHLVSTFYIKMSVSPCDRYLLSGSSDSNAYIWRLDSPALPDYRTTPLLTLEGHSAEVSAVAWCPHDLGRVVTLSDDNTMWVWRQTRRSGGELGSVRGTTKMLPSCKNAGNSKPPTTPRKGSTLPRSPAKISSAVRHAISSLHRPLVTSSHTPRLVSPSITSFFSKSVPVRPIASPRKLTITPKKSIQTDPNTITVGGVKRKLCIDDCEENRLESELENLGVAEFAPTGEGYSGGLIWSDGSSRKILEAVRFNSDRNPRDKNLERPDSVLETTEDCLHESKKLNSTSTTGRLNGLFNFSSPTANLPNSVLDAQPAIHAGYVEKAEPGCVRTPDWLTQYRIVKQQSQSAEKVKRGRPSCSPSTVKRKTVAKLDTLNRSASTPKSAKH